MAKKKAAKKKATKKKAVKKKAAKKKVAKKEEPEAIRRQSMKEVMTRHPAVVANQGVIEPDHFSIFAFPRLFTGVIDIDLVLRPCIGKRTCLIGKESKGKTLTSHIFAGAAQRTCISCFLPIIPWVNEETGEIKECCKCGANQRPSIIHVDVEDSFDPWWARAWGVDIEEAVHEGAGYNYMKSADESLYVVLPDDIEATFNYVADAVRSGATDFVIFDSFAMMMPKADYMRDKKIVSVENAQVGARAKLVGQGLTRIMNGQIYAKKHFNAKVSIIWTNQYYSGPTKGPWDSPNKAAAGLKARHAADHTMTFISASLEQVDKGVMGRGAKHSTILFQASKSKAAGTPAGKGEFKVYLDDAKYKHGIRTAGDTDEPDRLYDYLQDLGLAGNAGKYYECLGRKFDRVKDLISFLRRRDIQYIARYFIFRELMPVSARAYLEVGSYDYNPWGRDIAFKLFAKEDDKAYEETYAPDQVGDTGEPEGDRKADLPEDWL